MAKKCEANITILDKGTISVPLGQESDDIYKLDNIYRIISENPEIQALLTSTKPLNRPNRYEVNKLDDITQFPLSNTTVKEVANMYGGKLAALYSKIDAVPEENLLLLNTKFTFDGFSTAGLYSKEIDGVTRKLTILNGDINNIANYLAYHYIINKQLENPDLKAIYKNLKGVDEYKTNLVEFLKYYFFDTKARLNIDKVLKKDGVNVLNELITSLIDNDTKYPSLTDPTVQTFLDNLTDGYISRKDLDEFKLKYNLSNDDEAIRFLNYRGANLITIYKDENVIVFDQDKKETLEIPSNSVYIKDIINDYVDYKEGYKMYRVQKNNKTLYFISNIEVNKLGNKTILFDSAEDAIADFEKRYRLKPLEDCKLNIKTNDKIACRLYKFPTKFYTDWVFDKNWSKKPYSDIYKEYRIKYKKLFEDHPDWLNAITIPYNLLVLLSIKSQYSYTYMKQDKPIDLIPNVRSNAIIEEDIRQTKTAFTDLMNIKTLPYIVNEDLSLTESETPLNSTLFNNNTIFNNNRDQVNDLFTLTKYLQNTLGVKINLVNTYSAKWLTGTDAKAFIYNGEIYINIDKATNADLIHEYGHLILGTVKQVDNGLYQVLITSITASPEFKNQFANVKISYPGRAYQDLLEEVYCNMFGQYIGGNVGKFNKIITIMFGLMTRPEDISNVATMTFSDLIQAYGSTVFKSTNYNLMQSSLSRKNANIIEKGIKEGQIKEKCQ